MCLISPKPHYCLWIPDTVNINLDILIEVITFIWCILVTVLHRTVVMNKRDFLILNNEESISRIVS